MEKHMEPRGAGPDQVLCPWYIPRDESCHLLPKGQRRSWWAAKFDAGSHMGRVREQTKFCRHILSCFAESCSQFFFAHCWFINNQPSIVFLALGKVKRSHCGLPNKAHGRQNYQKAAKQHVIPDIGEDSRAQDNLKESQQPVTTGPETSMHCLNGMAIVNVKIQLMSGHFNFLSLWVYPLVVSEVVALANEVLYQSRHYCDSKSDLLVQTGLSYSLLLRGDCLSAVTVAWGESLSQTGRGPALRAFISEIGQSTTSWAEGAAEGDPLICAPLYSICWGPACLEQDHRRLWDVMDEAVFCRTFTSTIPFEFSRSHKVTRSNGAHQLLANAVTSRLTGITYNRYALGAAAKSAAGICTPSMHLELTHALAWFFVSDRPPFFGVLFAYPAIGILSVMVARAGQPSGWPVSSGCAGSANPVRATTMRFAPLVGSKNLSHPEAAIMATVPTPVTPEIRLVNGQAVTTSLALANYFNKRHDNVIAKIDSLDCSSEFRLLNFQETVYDRPNPAGGAPIPTPCYLLTRDGFFFVAMGFTGRRAAEFKEAYITAFNAMEQQYYARFYTALEANVLHRSVSEAHDFYQEIRTRWEDAIYPSLKAVQSPLAHELYDRFEWMSFLLAAIARQVSSRVPGQGKTGGQHEKA